MEPYLLAHEFLYLLCNCEDRLKTIKRLHKPELVSNKGTINHWELQNNGHHEVSHFDVLSRTAFENKAPHVIIHEVLNKEAEEKHIRILGLHPTTTEPKSALLLQATQNSSKPVKKVTVNAEEGSGGGVVIGVKSELSITERQES